MNERETEAIDSLVAEFRNRLISNYHQVNKMALESGTQPLRFENLCQKCCDYFGLDLDIMMSTETRLHEYTRARSIVYWVMRQRDSGFNYSLSKMGEMMGGFTHATVINSIRKFEEEFEFSSDFQFDVNNLLGLVGFKVVNRNRKFYLELIAE